MEKKKEIGITLIALVITIIVLLILAGITVAQLSNNGLFDNVRLAKEKYKNAQDYEDEQVEIYSSEVNGYLNGDRLGNGTNIFYPDYANRTTITFTNKSYTVESDGCIQIYFSYSNDVSYTADSVSVNNKIVYSCGTSSKYANMMTPFLFVKAGDVVQYTNTSQNVTGYYYSLR